ncbi:TBD2A protein, partial [Formicarius rufipectus]|nr:TBD2A protein [Formicarius rufipectus]
KLCGYLNKLGIKGPIKTWKSRWFIYDENKCHLVYYRTAQDINPLGSIELSSASFDCKMENGEGIFEIRTPNRVFTLKAISKQAMMYWLQQLQMRRWEFCNTKSRFPWNSVLLIYVCVLFCFYIDVVDNEDFLPLVKTPTDAVGLKAASLPAPQTSTALQNISLKHPWTEIQNTVFNICGSKQLWGNENVFSFDEFQEHPANLDEEQEAEEGTLEDGRMESRLNWIRKARWKNSGFPDSHEEPSRERNTMDKVSVLQQQILTLTEEVKSQKELVKLLHKALEAAQQEKRVSSVYLAAAEDKDRLELVRHKVRQIADLTSRLEALEQEKKELEQILILRDSHIQELKEHVQLLMEKNHAKQEVIMALTEQMAQELSDPLQEDNTITAETLYKQQEEIEHLKDDIDAYKTQNQFLNSEIHQVTRLWTSVAENEKALLMKCACLQARNCQMESKYLTVLRKLQEAVPGLPSSYADLVKNLIQEALQWDVKEEAEGTLSFELTMALCSTSEYDEYGFMTVPDYEIEDWKLLAKIQALEIKSNKLRSHEIVEKPLHDRWNSIGELNLSTELKSLIRSGIPVEHRQRVWRWIVSRHCSHLPGHYQRLLQQSKSTEHPASRQIELDLPRTLTNNKHFSSPTSQLIPKLRRVLLAFSWHNPAIGYCQGLNRLAAVALLVLEDEENAFWCLVHIVENLMPPDYYSDTLITSQVDQRVFKDFLSEKLPRLMAHLEQYQIDVSLITFNWFLVAFVDSLVSDILLRVWDAFLYEGTKVIFRYALAIFKYNEEEILRIHDSVEIYQYLRFFTRMIMDGRKLMNIAFNDLNPFPMKLLRNRRSMHREELEAELCELEQIKAAYVKERAEQGL